MHTVSKAVGIAHSESYRAPLSPAILAGLFFDNGFLDITSDTGDKKVLVNYISLRAGILF